MGDSPKPQKTNREEEQRKTSRLITSDGRGRGKAKRKKKSRTKVNDLEKTVKREKNFKKWLNSNGIFGRWRSSSCPPLRSALPRRKRGHQRTTAEETSAAGASLRRPRGTWLGMEATGARPPRSPRPPSGSALRGCRRCTSRPSTQG